jgi:hypothetical protein
MSENSRAGFSSMERSDLNHSRERESSSEWKPRPFRRDRDTDRGVAHGLARALNRRHKSSSSAEVYRVTGSLEVDWKLTKTPMIPSFRLQRLAGVLHAGFVG